jgi:PhzF family phenazine biosynthesis protein
VEVDLCGHATLATAHVLFEHLGLKNDFIHFSTVHHGLVKVFRSGDRITLEFPSTPPVRTACPDALTRGLGIIPPEVLESRDLMAVFETEEQIIRIQPVFDQLKLLPHLGVIITAPGSKTDFVSRFFAPNAGIDEDPVTGSAHTTLIPYWSARLKKKNMVARQVSSRGGDLFCEERNDKVLIAGYARTFFKGEITW